MKARIRKTGEIVDIICYSSNTTRSDVLDSVSYIDSKGNEHSNVRKLNLYWDFEIIEDNSVTRFIDWKQRRYEIAKAAMQGILSDKGSQEIAMNPHRDEYREYSIGIAKYAVACADALIEELKKNN